MGKLFKDTKDIVFKQKEYEMLGQGAFSKVQLVSHISHPNKLYAMKKLKKKNKNEVKYIK